MIRTRSSIRNFQEAAVGRQRESGNPTENVEDLMLDSACHVMPEMKAASGNQMGAGT
jgi:hypothetical protein